MTALPGDRDEKYHFSWSGLRSDDNVIVFYSYKEAAKHRDACNEQTKGDTVILQRGSWREVS